MKSRSVSITGATGFVGWHLCRSFAAAGWSVQAIVRPGTRKQLPGGVAVVEAPLQAEGLARAFKGTDLVVHSAAVIRAATEQKFVRTNVGGTRAVVEAANAAGARLVHLSSQAAIGPGTPDRPAKEDDPPRPINDYGRSKLASEAVVREHSQTAWTILRPSAVYGPRDRGFLPLFRLARRGITILASPPSVSYTFLFVDDLMHAIERAATDARAVGETYFVGHSEPQPVDALMGALARASGRRYRPLRLPALLMDVLAAAGDLGWRVGLHPTLDSGRLAELRAPGFVCSVERIHRQLGFVAVTSLDEGIARTARWYREAGWT